MHDFGSAKRQILDRVGIVDVVSPYVNLKRAGRRMVGLCPFHQERTPSFSVSPEQGFFKCFGCGKGGDIFTFIQLRENLPFGEVLRMLADRAGVELPKRSAAATNESGVTRTDVLAANAWAAQWFSSNLNDGEPGAETRRYVADRGISEESVKRFGLGLTLETGPGLRSSAAKKAIADAVLTEADLMRVGDSGRPYDTFRNRLMFPIRDVTGRVIGFGGRTLADDPAKYLNTRQNSLFDKGRGLYAIDLARDAMVQKGRAILVEGYTDCIAAHQAGFTETVATLGTALTEAQVELIRRYCETIIVLFDSDDAGAAAADRAIRVAVPRGLAVRLARVPEGKDPCEFLAKGNVTEFADVIDRGEDAMEFVWRQTLTKFEGGVTNVRRREAVMDFLKLVGSAFEQSGIDAILRGLLANQVAHLLRIDREQVYQKLSVPRSEVSVGPSRRVAPEAEQGAWSDLLGVVLNEPALLHDVTGSFEVSRIIDERDRRIGLVVLDLWETIGDFHLADVVSALEHPEDVERLEELSRRAAERGNYQATLQVALERMKHARRFANLSDWRVSGSAELEQVPNAADEMSSLQEGLRSGHPFVPARLRRQVVPPTPVTPANESSLNARE